MPAYRHKDRDEKKRSRQWKPTCFLCGQKGHIQRDCPNSKKKDERMTKHNAKPAKEPTPVDSDTQESDNGAFTASSNTPTRQQWLIDSGATSHMTYSKGLLRRYHKFDVVSLGDGRMVEAEGSGDIGLGMIFKVSNKKGCTMKNVLYVPKLTSNLFSVRAAVSKGNHIRFGAGLKIKIES